MDGCVWQMLSATLSARSVSGEQMDSYLLSCVTRKHHIRASQHLFYRFCGPCETHRCRAYCRPWCSLSLSLAFERISFPTSRSSPLDLVGTESGTDFCLCFQSLGSSVPSLLTEACTRRPRNEVVVLKEYVALRVFATHGLISDPILNGSRHPAHARS